MLDNDIKEVKTMNITEFAKGRNIDRNAVSMYIRRHPELFEEHVKTVGKNVEIDDFAYQILDKKYPLPSPVTIIDGISFEEHKATLEELANMQKHVIRLEEELRQQTYLVAQAEAKEILLEDRQKQLEEQKQLCKELSAEVDRLKNQTFWQRVFGR